MQINQKLDNVAYSDETHHNIGRYRGIGLVTLNKAKADQFKIEINKLLSSSDVKEVKWAEVKSAKKRFAAEKLIDFSFNKALSRELRVDILVWDTHDSRHKVFGRDDNANLQVLYFQLFKNVLLNRWGDRCLWFLFPDEQSAINWHIIKSFLNKHRKNLNDNNNLFGQALIKEFDINDIEPKQSHNEPLIQVADIYAGMAVYSRTNFAKYRVFCEMNDCQQKLFAPDKEIKFSNADEERCALIKDFIAKCKSKKFGVSLDSSSGLRTLDPKNPLNFWLYIPQHDKDKAPTYAF